MPHIDVYVVADVPTTSHAIDLISTCGFGCVPVVYVLFISRESPNSEVIWRCVERKDEILLSNTFDTAHLAMRP